VRFEKIQNTCIPKVGFGTWRIGGEGLPDSKKDNDSLAALKSALSIGYRHFDTAESYAAGHAEELLGLAIQESGIPRGDLFITSKVSPDHLSYESVLSSFENSLKRLKMDYLDLYLIHWPRRGMNLADTFRALNQLVCDGRVRHLGVSNFKLKELREAVALSQSPLFTNQVSYSIPDRRMVENGLLDYCRQQSILITAYTPINHRNTRSSKTIQRIAETRGCTREQVALAWLVSQPGVITIPMSFNPQHQRENFQAADIQLTAEEMELLG